MTTMEEIQQLTKEQFQLGKMIAKLLENMKKDEPSRKMQRYIDDKRETFLKYWQEFEERDHLIKKLNITEHGYFQKGFYEQVKAILEDALQLLDEYQNWLNEDDLVKQSTRLTNPSKTMKESAGIPIQQTTNEMDKTKEAEKMPDKETTSGVEHTTSSDSSTAKNSRNSDSEQPSNHEECDFTLHNNMNNDEQKLRLKRQMVKMSTITRLMNDIIRHKDQSHPTMYYEYKRWTLNDHFNSVAALHEEIIMHEQEFIDSYFRQDAFGQLETEIQEIMVWLHEIQNSGIHQPVGDAWTRLPRQTIPTFEGNYNDWTGFRDIFTKVIHNNNRLCNAEKLQYLKTNLRGEAARLIKHIQISDANYLAAWDLINDRYNNKRALLFAQLDLLFNQQNQNLESSGGLKSIHDITRECIHAIQNLGIETDTWGPIIVFKLIKKLDKDTRRWYEQAVKEPREIPDLKEFLKLLETRFQSLENLKEQRRNNDVIKPSLNTRFPAKSFHSTQTQCKYCNGAHLIYNCKKFVSSAVGERYKFIKNSKLCINCLNHKEDVKCYSQQRCGVCRGYHHTLLHLNQGKTEQEISRQKPVATHSAMTKKEQPPNSPRHVILATALVKVKTVLGNYDLLRALIDPGSQASFITERAAQSIGLPRTKTDIEISGVGNVQSGKSKSKVVLQLSPRFPSDFQLRLEALILPSLTKLLPNETIPYLDIQHQDNMMLADPTLDVPGPIDILIGADVFSLIIMDGVKRPTEGLLAQKTEFGWILTGRPSKNRAGPSKIISMVSTTELNKQLEKFWEVEELTTKTIFSEDDQICEDNYQHTYRRDKNGTYTVHLPLKEGLNKIGESRKVAAARLLQLEKRFLVNPELKKEYCKFMKEYLEQGHMRRIEPELQVPKPHYYLPHQAVIKNDSTTTKLRVVFDASAKSSTGYSLNDMMHTGPRLQENLSDILLRSLKYKYVFKSDIEKMYRMIKVADEHQNLQRVLWRFSNNEKIKEYALTTVTYGTAAAPYLAIRTLKQLAIDEKNAFPKAADIALKDFYVDDLMSGADSMEEGKMLQMELLNLLRSGGFNLRKWASNSRRLLSMIPTELREKGQIEINGTESIKTLGIYWSPATDTFHFKTNVTKELPTKRNILSDIAKLFDPLGWLSPIMITAKRLMQELWIEGSPWDEQIREDLAKKWHIFKTELPQIDEIIIPRWMNHTKSNLDIQLHGFCDASEKAYAAAVYSKTTTKEGKTHTTLLTAKTKVAPIKMKKTLPRLELCGAALLAKLLHQVKVALEFPDVTTYAWTDSTIVIAWIRGGPEKWKSFVSNKVSEIQDLTTPNMWRHVRSEDNPADVASRGINPSKLRDSKLWWTGPHWLKEKKENWPILQGEVLTTEEIKRNETICGATVSNNNLCEEIITRYSKLPKLLRVWAYCLRFINACCKERISTTQVTITETTQALNSIIRMIQRKEFSLEIKRIQKGRTVDNQSSIAALNPFVDPEGLLRLGGRIGNADISYNEKNPIILPHNHHITELIVREAHENTLHGSIQVTLAFIRRKFWIIKSRSAVKSVINKCIRCIRYKAQIPTQQMGNLPLPRVTPSKPFSHTGVDYAGPIKTKASRIRGNTTHKGYIAVFICLATKAIHLELVSSLTTEDFLAALRRFFARRGRCTHIYSDNATTFVGAQKILDQDLKKAIKNNNSLADTLAGKGTEWHFIPPAAPHFGGIWEAGVKSVKYHLKRVIGESILTFEEMTTLLCQIEACLNSRPLCPLTDDPSDLNILTPAHFLIGEALIGPPEPQGLTESHHYNSRWEHIQRMNRDFWKAWSTNYLNYLQQRPKWRNRANNMQIGQIVLLRDENLSPTNWPLAKIKEVHPGKDGLVRVVTVQYRGNNELKRPISKICPLPINLPEPQETAKSSIGNNEEKLTGNVIVCAAITKLDSEMQESQIQHKNSPLSFRQCSNKLKQETSAIVAPSPSKRARKESGHEVEDRTTAYRRRIEQAKQEAKQLNPKRCRIHPVTTKYDCLIPIGKQKQLTDKYRARMGYTDSAQATKKRITLNEYRNRKKGLNTTFITLLLLSLLFKLGKCSLNITRPQPGLYVEDIGEIQLKRGTFRVELKFSTDEIKTDISKLNQTIEQVNILCEETLKISRDTHCDGLIHHLTDIHIELYKHIKILQAETIRERRKRGVLGNILQTVFGVNDEVYADINDLEHNQQLLQQAVNHQTNIMLTTLATVNETEMTTIKKLNSFTDKLNKGLEAIKAMQQQWFAGPDANKLNIQFLAVYHAATSYIEELGERYNKLMNAYTQRGNLLDFLQPADLLKIIGNAKSKLPSNLDILNYFKTPVEMNLYNDEIKIYGYLHIIEHSRYTLIKCTAIPQRLKERHYAVMELPASTLAINYNIQTYFMLREDELDHCVQIKKHNFVCTPSVVRSIENNPNCVIDELYQRQEGHRCTIREFELHEIIWKQLYMTNTWLFISNKPATAALQCNGIREDISLNGTGILKVPQNCIVQTRRNILKSEVSISVPVRASFIKPVEINFKTTITKRIAPDTEVDAEPVIKTSEQIYTRLRKEGQEIQVTSHWRNIRTHAVGTSLSVLAIGTIIGLVFAGRFTWKRWQAMKTTKSSANDSPTADQSDAISEFNLYSLPSPRQNVQT